MDSDHFIGQHDHNQALLEGLFQLAVSDGADSEDFAVIDQEVYARLLDTYQPSA